MAVPGIRQQPASSGTILSERGATQRKLQELTSANNQNNRAQKQVSQEQSNLKQQQIELNKRKLEAQRRQNDLIDQARMIAQSKNKLQNQLKTSNGSTQITYSSTPLPSRNLNENPTETQEKVGLYIDASV